MQANHAQPVGRNLWLKPVQDPANVTGDLVSREVFHGEITERSDRLSRILVQGTTTDPGGGKPENLYMILSPRLSRKNFTRKPWGGGTRFLFPSNNSSADVVGAYDLIMEGLRENFSSDLKYVKCVYMLKEKDSSIITNNYSPEQISPNCESEIENLMLKNTAELKQRCKLRFSQIVKKGGAEMEAALVEEIGKAEVWNERLWEIMCMGVSSSDSGGPSY